MTETTETATAAATTGAATADASTGANAGVSVADSAADGIGPLTTEQQVAALRAAHEYFSRYDRVTGTAASAWAQALDAIGIVANDILAKNRTGE